MKKYIDKVRRFVARWKALKDMPLHLEFVLSDYCNLNCKGCTHYSPVAPREFESLEALKRDADHLGRVCGAGVKEVYLIGGETLLYPELPQAMDIVKSAFTQARLLVFTNGLVLGRMDDVFWESARRNDVVIAITRYPVEFDYDGAEALCRSHGVEVEVFGDRTNAGSFFRFALDPEGRQNRYISHFKCYNRGCVSVVDGFVYPCSTSACIGHLNRAFGTKFEHRPADRLPVDSITDVRQILRLRDRAVPFCRYCKNPPRAVPYGISKRKMEEWVD